jgi:hypothetical protein
MYKKPVVIDECAYEGNIHRGWGSITGEEMVRRFWEGYVRGGYVGHRIFKMPANIKFKVEIIDTWNMTIKEVPGVFEGTFRIDLPSIPYMAVRMRAVEDE